MRLKSVLAVVGLAAATAGVTAAVAADRAQTSQQVHVMPVHVVNLRMPDGSVQQVRYLGDVVPHVVAVPVAYADPMLAAFGPGSPFAMMDRISADMDRQMAGMMRQAAMMQRMTPQQLQQAALAGAPAGATSSFTMISTTGGNGACSQSVRMVSLGDGKAPQVTRTASGDCGSAVRKPTGLTPTALPATAKTPTLKPAVLAPRPTAPKLDPNSI